MARQTKLSQMSKLFQNELQVMAKTYEKRLERYKSDFISVGISFPQKYIVSFYLDDDDLEVTYMISRQTSDPIMARLGQYVAMCRVNSLEEFDKFFNETFQIVETTEPVSTEFTTELIELQHLPLETFFFHSGDLYSVKEHDRSLNITRAVKMLLDGYYFNVGNVDQSFSADTAVTVFKPF